MRPTETLPDVTGMDVAVDTETSGLHTDDGCRTSTVSVAWFDGDSVISHAFPFNQGPKGKSDQDSLLDGDGHNLDKHEWQSLLGWLGKQRLGNQNMKFDLHMLRVGTDHWAGIDLEPQTVWDTMLASKELDPMEPTSLKPTAERLKLLGGGERDEEQAIKEYLKWYAKTHKVKYSQIQGRYDLVPWEIMSKYAAKDAVLALLLWRHQIERIDCGESNYRWVDRELEVMRVLYRMEMRGIGYDAAQSLEIADLLEDRITKLSQGLPFEPTPDGAKDYWFRQQGITPYAVTEKKRDPKLDDEILKKMVKDGIEWAEEYQEIRKLQTANSKWYRAYAEAIGGDGRLRTSFRQAKVVSGRWSSERINLQAIPHDYRLELLPEGTPSVRALFKAAPGKVLWEMDLAQAELRVAAKMANAKTMLRYIEEGQDAHGETARELFEVTPDSPDWFPKRQVSKRGNFSLIFGVGPPTLQADIRKQTGIELSRPQSEKVVYGWRKIHPEFQRAIYRVQQQVEAVRYVRLANGRIRWFAPHEDTHKAFNQQVQGSIAELVKDWCIEIEKREPGVLVLQIHDSTVIEVPEDWDEQRVAALADLGAKMATEMFGVPMEVEHKRWSNVDVKSW